MLLGDGLTETLATPEVVLAFPTATMDEEDVVEEEEELWEIVRLGFPGSLEAVGTSKWILRAGDFLLSCSLPGDLELGAMILLGTVRIPFGFWFSILVQLYFLK